MYSERETISKYKWYLTLWILVTMLMAASVKACEAQTVYVPYSTFVVEYDTANWCPAAVRWSVSGTDIGRHKRPSVQRFHGDDRIPGSFQINDAYSHSGYDRGHLCPSADRSADRVKMAETFSALNICPQRPNCNRKSWLHTETITRSLATRFGSVSVVAAPFFLPTDTLRIGRRGIRVPSWFFKWVYCSHPDTILRLFIIKNE